MSADLTISDVDAWETLDSRGRPTVTCQIRLSCGRSGVTSVPSGQSVGSHEALELRDGGVRYFGYGVRRAVENVRTTLRAAVVGLDAGDQTGIDEALRGADPTPDLSLLGANAILAVSVTAAVAGSAGTDEPLYRRLGGKPSLPLPMVNVISGGAHAGGLIDIQDVLVVPVGAGSFAEALELAARVRSATAEVAASWGFPTSLVADEGGIGVPLANNRAALELLCRGIEQAGLQPGEDAAIAIDVAATQFHRNGHYVLAIDQRELGTAEWVETLESWCTDFPLVSIEDPCAEDDWDGWRLAAGRLGKVQVIGDDLFVTSRQLLDRGIEAGIGNAILVKPNQNGTLSGASEVVRRARQAGYATIVSARSGETEDTWLADLAVGWSAGQIKVGSTTRSERTAKWNRLLQIEREIGAGAYVGAAALATG